MKKPIRNSEMEMLQNIAAKFIRHPDQLNRLSEADAEILSFKNKVTDYLVFKIDGLYEELQQKLYEDPYLIGWMSVTVTISDIAAVGANPFGILIALQLPDEYLNNQKWYKAFQSGINDACAEYRVYILGGDTNSGSALSVTTSCIATADGNKPLMRSGMKVGQLLYCTGNPGLGNAFAFSRFFDQRLKVMYQPKARLSESKIIKQFATSCMDTSDGLFPALSVLSEVNKVGFCIIIDTSDLVHSSAKQICDVSHVPFWIMMAGPHGDYELIFTLNPEDKEAFELVCHKADIQFKCLGFVTADQKLQFISETKTIVCETATIANLFEQAKGDINCYFDLLMKQHISWH